MADNILKNSLSGLSSQPLPDTPQGLQAPDLTGNNRNDISTLSRAQQKPSDLLNLQKSLQVGSNQAYRARQASEMEQASGQFDPTKVSGGTFAGIIGNLEQNRGMDIGKIYASTMSTYAQVQDTITSRLEFLQNLEMKKEQFEEQMDLNEKEYKLMEKRDKQAAKEYKKDMEEDTRRWEMEYALTKQKLNQANGLDYITAADQIVNQEDGVVVEHNAPQPVPDTQPREEWHVPTGSQVLDISRTFDPSYEPTPSTWTNPFSFNKSSGGVTFVGE